MKKLIATLATAVLAVGAAQALTAPAAQSSPAAPTSPAASELNPNYTPPAINFGKCSSSFLDSLGAQCGFLTVPLDYSHPQGAKIKLAVSEIKHTATPYQGVMLTNPGGPGGAGLTLSFLKYLVPNGGGDGYDWIGFDPRAVGTSEPALTCDPSFFHGDRPPYRPTTSAIYKAWVTRSKAYAAACKIAENKELFKHVTTLDTINDMESLRKALGQDKISYYGFSYGTTLGQTYLTLHPDRVKRVVLDSNVDPRQTPYENNQAQDKAFQKTFDIYFAYLAKWRKVFDVGDTYSEVRHTFEATQAKLDKHAAGGVLGGDELLDVFTSAGYYVYGWVDIGNAYSKYLHTGDASDLIQMYQDANPTGPGGDNGYALYLGTQCTDAVWPSQNVTDPDNWQLDRNYPYFTWSNAWFNGPCDYWPFPVGGSVPVRDTGVKVPILLIDETYDAATPYAGTLYVRKLFPTASMIEGLNGSTHAGSLSGVACTDDTISAYLKKGIVPTRRPGNQADRICPPVPQPDPTAASANARTGSVSPALLHKVLQAAAQIGYGR